MERDRGGVSEEKCIHQLFEEQAERTPDATAVAFEDQSLTYRELDRRANRLARLLRDWEAAGGASRDLHGAVIGDGGGAAGHIEGGGGRHVPLDPSYPDERLRFMLDDSGAAVLVSQRRIERQLPEVAAPCIPGQRLGRSTTGRRRRVRPGNAGQSRAHYLHLGSTGRPKAVAAVHSAVVNRLEAEREISGISGQDVCCQKTSIGFVDAVAETWSPLLSGRLLIVASEAEAKEPRKLLSLIGREGVTRLVTVPSLAPMLESPKPDGS